MANKNYDLRPLQWDTDYFGVSSARVDLRGKVDQTGQDEIMQFCKGYDFVTIANRDNIKENNYWIANKTSAFLADLNIQFIKRLQNYTIAKMSDENITVMDELPYDQQIVAIAGQSFNYSRFFNDPHLPFEQARNIYLYWTKCAFEKLGKYFVMYQKNGKVVGYILFSMAESAAVIELIAVDQKYQGQKIGKSLVEAMTSFVIDQGIKKIKVGTQVNNISAAQFYHMMGFKYVACSSVYHLWRQ